MTEKPSAAYLAGYFFGREGRRTERRFDDVAIEIKAYAEGIVDGRRTARAAEDWRKVIEHERSLGLHWQDRLMAERSPPGACMRPPPLVLRNGSARDRPLTQVLDAKEHGERPLELAVEMDLVAAEALQLVGVERRAIPTPPRPGRHPDDAR